MALIIAVMKHNNRVGAPKDIPYDFEVKTAADIRVAKLLIEVRAQTL